MSRTCRLWILPALGGFAVPVLGLLLWGYAHGVLAELHWTALAYPRLMAEALEHDGGRLGRRIPWFVSSFGPALLLAAWGLVSRAVRGPCLPVYFGALTWLIVGAVLAAGQLSWWKYYTLILTVPLGVLASVGLDGLAKSSKRGLKLFCGVACAAALVPGLTTFASSVDRLVRHDLALSPANRLAFQQEAHERLARALPQAEFIRREIAADETVYVLGNPLILFLTGRSYAIPINGWSPEAWAPAVRIRVYEQLHRSRPAYIFVAPFGERLMDDRYDPMQGFLKAEYEPVSSGEAGTWYRRRMPAPRAGRGG